MPRSPMGKSIVLVSAELAAEITARIPDEDISAFQTHVREFPVERPNVASDVG